MNYKEVAMKKGISNRICLFAFVIFGVFVGLAHINNSFSYPNKKHIISTPKEETRKEQIEKNFSAWNGAHYGLTEVIKKVMNDPGSYEHVETVYWDKSDYLVVKTIFRGKNAFGGVVMNWITAKVDLNGNVIDVISQGS
jgi:hypothetical protein